MTDEQIAETIMATLDQMTHDKSISHSAHDTMAYFAEKLLEMLQKRHHSAIFATHIAELKEHLAEIESKK